MTNSNLLNYQKKRRRAHIILLALLFAICVSFGTYTYYISIEHDKIQYETISTSETVLNKSRILENLRKSIGYGGFIHNFKNYVIRNRADYYDNVANNYRDFLNQIEAYRSISSLSEEEKLALSTISDTLKEYADNLELAKSLIERGASITEIDDNVIVSDIKAIAALNTLESLWKDLLRTHEVQLVQSIESTKNITHFTRIFITIASIVSIVLFWYIYRLDQYILLLYKEIELSEEKFREMVNSSADAIITISDEGRIETFNKKASDLFGYEHNEILSKNVAILLPPEDRQEHHHYIANATTFAPKVINRPRGLYGFHKNGSRFPIELNIASYMFIDKRKYIGIVRDISERKIIEETLLETKRKAEEASATKSRFLANVSHELRTPLNAIIGFSRIILDEVFGKISPERYREYVSDISSAGEHLHEIINDILDLSRIELGKLDLKMRVHDVREIIDAAVKLTKTDADKKKIYIKTDLPVTIVPFKCDQLRIKQILINIIGNAIKYTPDGGSINVTCSLHNDDFEISVRDTGIGIPKDKLEIILEPFLQHEHDLSTSNQGAGLGLAISKLLVELHGGQILIDSVVNEGSEFKIVFPSVT